MRGAAKIGAEMPIRVGALQRGEQTFRIRPIADLGRACQNKKMGKVEPAERYAVTIDLTVRTRDELFSRITDTVYLGYSSFDGWDQFNDMFLGRLDGNILDEIANEDLSGLPERDRAIYLEILKDAAQEYPDKLRLI